MKNFKTDDVVVCIDNKNVFNRCFDNLSLDKSYIVMDTSHTLGELFITMRDDCGIIRNFKTSRFAHFNKWVGIRLEKLVFDV